MRREKKMDIIMWSGSWSGINCGKSIGRGIERVDDVVHLTLWMLYFLIV